MRPGRSLSLLALRAGRLINMQREEAEALVARIERESGLAARVVDDDDDAFCVDIDLPQLPGEVRATATAHELDDWPWLYETHIRPRLTQPPA